MPAALLPPPSMTDTPPPVSSPLRAQAPQADADVNARVRAINLLGGDKSLQGLVLLYMLADDADQAVQAAALDAVERRCRHELSAICVAMRAFFVGEGADSETCDRARDLLLADDPELALRAASLAYKLDLAARLSEATDAAMGRAAALRVLRLLAEDPQPEVQEAAGAALLRANG